MIRIKLISLSVALFSLVICDYCLGQSNEEDNNIIVVANIDSDNITLSKQQVKNLFMGSSLGLELEVVTLPSSSIVRVSFNTKIIGLTEDRIQSFWAQMRFTGRKTQPKQLENLESLLEYVSTTPRAVTYLPSSIDLPDNVKILYQTAN